MRIGRYEVLGEVARGGFGVVLRARDPALSRDVAIKLLLAGAGANETQRRRFEREVDALARLRHPNIVSVHQAGSIREGPYIVMDFVDGESLDQRLARDGPLPVREALRVMELVARAIDHAHGRGVLHRDLKPGNVLVDRTGAAMVTDFGLSREVDPRLSASALSRSGAAIGTPGFWPPEQAYGRLDAIGPRSDVYGLGATLYALLTGGPPYEAPSLVELMGRMTAPPPPPSTARPEVPAAVDAAVLRALAHDPAERHASAGALADALAECRRRTRGGGAPERRSPWPLALAAAAWGLRLAWREAGRAPRWLVLADRATGPGDGIASGAGPDTLDGRPLARCEIAWRGPLAFV
ncbi:MAG: serine/threonine protein kinase, partial [Planctomycetes bacterium]|nr:serine/threonine protein kinase [Planctomycetota bacterium]